MDGNYKYHVCSRMSMFVSLFLSIMFVSVGVTYGQMVPAVFVFGDSLVDVGNNNYLPISLAKADFPHNGVDFPTKKATGRFSNGKNAADFLAEKLGLPTSPPYLSLNTTNSSAFLTGVSFASGGAGIFNGTDDIYKQSITLSKQVNYYIGVYQSLVKYMGSSRAQKHLSKSIYFIVVGSNDIFDYGGSSDKRKNYTPQQYVDLMAASLKVQLKRLHAYGARKFVIPGVATIGCCPSQRLQNSTGGCNEVTNGWSHQYNQVLVQMLQSLKSELNDISYSYYNLYSAMEDFIHNPASHGFAEVKAACCGLGNLNAKVACLPLSTYCPNRRDHLFWDLYHPTEATARMMLGDLFDGPPQKTFPLNVRQLTTV